ncbi:MAG TPA: CRTAC1 family protein [Bryobacteraceae bacterium]|nr:CRTAC1 family protein [Bryobacteraceae bacterium]
MRRRDFLFASASAAFAKPSGQRFVRVQPELFSTPGAQPNCWGDFDNDGDLDLFVGFKAGIANRLYRNDGGVFSEIGAEMGLADLTDTRAAAWGDFDADGALELYVGFTRRSQARNKLYKKIAGKYVDIAHQMGVDAMGETRQVSWIDFDNDGRVDLFIAFRDAPNMLFHNEGGRFVNVASEMGADDPRKTVGAVWFDFNEDGRLDLFVANQDGTLNGLFENRGGKFVDVAHELGMDAFGRAANYGSNGPSVADYNNDGRLDLFVASYGPNFLFRNDGGGKFTNVAKEMGVEGGERATPSNWGDYDNDGRVDLYVSSYIDKPLNERDYLYHNDGARFSEGPRLEHGATHGIQWADFDGDGTLDLAIANNNPGGTHSLYRNVMAPDAARRSIQVMVHDRNGRYTKPGAEVRIYKPGTRQVWGGRIVDSGSGYCSQSAMPVHFGLPKSGRVDVEVTTFESSGRKITRAASVDPNKLARRTLVMKV